MMDYRNPYAPPTAESMAGMSKAIRMPEELAQVSTADHPDGDRLNRIEREHERLVAYCQALEERIAQLEERLA